MTTVVAISDTHMMHEAVELADGDILVHAGDFSGYGTSDELAKFVKWLQKLDYKHKLIIAGNHDGQFVEGTKTRTKALRRLEQAGAGIKFLENSAVTIDGVKFYGSPVTPRFGSWHYMRDRGADISEVWDKIPQDTDVLITHGPPYGHGDLTIPRFGSRNVGCLDLLLKVADVQPRYHVFGHIHSGYGATRSAVCSTTFVNAALANDDYEICRGAVVFHV